MSVKKSIGWCDMTLNPIKGRCLGGCWYCYYSREGGMLNRFKKEPELHLDLRVFYKLPKKSKRIFLCSTHDLFGDWVSERWRDLIFAHFKYYPQHTFQILTKFPQNINRKMPHNVWFGVTVETIDNFWRARELDNISARIKFISFEPLFVEIWNESCYSEKDFSIFENWFHWVIVGKLTGIRGNVLDPKRSWIEHIVKTCRYNRTPIFLKDNLKEIWGENLIQEFPK